MFQQGGAEKLRKKKAKFLKKKELYDKFKKKMIVTGKPGFFAETC